MTILLERQKVQNQLLEIVLDFSHPIQETTVGYWIITLQALTFYLIRNGVSWTFGVPRWHCGKQRPHGSHSRPFFADGSQGSQLCRRHPEPHVADVAVPCVNSLWVHEVAQGLLRACSAYALGHVAALRRMLECSRSGCLDVQHLDRNLGQVRKVQKQKFHADKLAWNEGRTYNVFELVDPQKLYWVHLNEPSVDYIGPRMGMNRAVSLHRNSCLSGHAAMPARENVRFLQHELQWCVCSGTPISSGEWRWLMHVIDFMSLPLPPSLSLSLSFCFSVRRNDMYGMAEGKN